MTHELVVCGSRLLVLGLVCSGGGGASQSRGTHGLWGL